MTGQPLWTGCQEQPLKRCDWDVEEKRGQGVRKAGEGVSGSRTGECQGSEVGKVGKESKATVARGHGQGQGEKVRSGRPSESGHRGEFGIIQILVSTKVGVMASFETALFSGASRLRRTDRPLRTAGFWRMPGTLSNFQGGPCHNALGIRCPWSNGLPGEMGRGGGG